MSAPIEVTNNQLPAFLAKLRVEGRRVGSITVIDNGYLVCLVPLPPQPELEALLQDANLLPAQREAITRMIEHSATQEQREGKE